MQAKPRRIGLVGIGKIARDQHLPSISASADFVLEATASRNASIGGVEAFRDLETLLARRSDIDCIVLCTPPQFRYRDARIAIENGRHVMLEKPPGATLAEVEDLRATAAEKDVSLFATWHSRFADCVAQARDWLADKRIDRLNIIWREDVRRWHPDQEWIWQPGGLGVFDPGINALSILTAIFPRRVHLQSALLQYPENRATPIAAKLHFFDVKGTTIEAEFDWRSQGSQTWEIVALTDRGQMRLSHGGSRIEIEGEPSRKGADHEYAGIYRRFHELVSNGQSEVDLAPMVHVFDAFAMGRRVNVAPFGD